MAKGGDSAVALRVAIDALTDKVVALRVIRQEGMTVADPLPKIEIRGMRDTVARARAKIAAARESFAALNDEVAGLAADADAVTEQVRAHRQDLRSEAMGNGSGDTGKEQ